MEFSEKDKKLIERALNTNKLIMAINDSDRRNAILFELIKRCANDSANDKQILVVFEKEKLMYLRRHNLLEDYGKKVEYIAYNEFLSNRDSSPFNSEEPYKFTMNYYAVFFDNVKSNDYNYVERMVVKSSSANQKIKVYATMNNFFSYGLLDMYLISMLLKKKYFTLLNLTNPDDWLKYFYRDLTDEEKKEHKVTNQILVHEDLLIRLSDELIYTDMQSYDLPKNMLEIVNCKIDKELAVKNLRHTHEFRFFLYIMNMATNNIARIFRESKVGTQIVLCDMPINNTNDFDKPLQQTRNNIIQTLIQRIASRGVPKKHIVFFPNVSSDYSPNNKFDGLDKKVIFVKDDKELDTIMQYHNKVLAVHSLGYYPLKDFGTYETVKQMLLNEDNNLLCKKLYIYITKENDKKDLHNQEEYFASNCASYNFDKLGFQYIDHDLTEYDNIINGIHEIVD